MLQEIGLSYEDQPDIYPGGDIDDDDVTVMKIDFDKEDPLSAIELSWDFKKVEGNRRKRKVFDNLIVRFTAEFFPC